MKSPGNNTKVLVNLLEVKFWQDLETVLNTKIGINVSKSKSK